MTLHASHDAGHLVLTQGRLTLREQLPAEAALLADGKPAGLSWIDGVPGEGTVAAATMTAAADRSGIYRPGWGLFAIMRTEDGTAVGELKHRSRPFPVVLQFADETDVAALLTAAPAVHA